MEALKKPRIEFPENDQYWKEVHNTLNQYFSQSNASLVPPVLAPIEFLKYFDTVLPYHFSHTMKVSDFSLIVVHKGELENIDRKFLEQVCKDFHIIFANPVFVVYSHKKQSGITVAKEHCNFQIPTFQPKARKNIRNIALVTANQFGNLGDDAITWSSYDMLQAIFPKAKIHIYSPPVSKKNIFESDLLVLGGGGIFYDGCIYNAMNYTRYIAWAKEAGIFSCGIGIGTQGIKTTLGCKLYQEILDLCDFISVRDRRDFEVLKYDLGLTTPIHLTQDMVFSLSRRSSKKVNIKHQKKPILFCSLVDSDFLLASKKLEGYKNTTKSILKTWQDKFDIWCLVQSEDDVEMYCESIAPERLVRIPFNDIGQVFNAYKQADVVLTSRFHGFIFSLLNQIPVIATGTKGGKIYRLIYNFLPSFQNTFIPIEIFDQEVVLKKLVQLQKNPSNFLIEKRQLSECIAASQTNKTLLNYYYSHLK